MHEIVGEIIASRHPDHTVGDLVVGWASSYLGLAELVVGHAEELTTFDPHLPATTAVMLQPLACVLYAVEQLGDIEGQRAAVVGQGPIGLLFSHVLSTRGASRVTGVDPIDRSEVAELFGVDETITAHSALWSARLPVTDRPQVIVESLAHQVSTLRDCVQRPPSGADLLLRCAGRPYLPVGDVNRPGLSVVPIRGAALG